MSSIIRKVSVTATALLLSVTVCTGCANSVNNVSNSYFDKTEIATESKTDSIITSDDKKDDISDILVNNANPPLTATSFIEMEGTGIPQSYEELQDFIRPYPSVNYLGFEIIKRYSAEEAFEITNDDIFLYGATLYDIHVTYDYINEQPLDIYTKLSSAGTPEEQFEGYPPYLEGDKFACFLPRFDPSVINYEFSELMFAIDDEVKTPIGYHIGFDKINFVDQEGISIADDNFTASSVITSTSNNPVTYTDMISMDNLTDFLKEDWTKRGYELNNSFLTVEDINETLQ